MDEVPEQHSTGREYGFFLLVLKEDLSNARSEYIRHKLLRKSDPKIVSAYISKLTSLFIELDALDRKDNHKLAPFDKAFGNCRALVTMYPTLLQTARYSEYLPKIDRLVCVAVEQLGVTSLNTG